MTMTTISKKAKDEIQSIIDDIRAGRKAWNQSRYFGRDNEGNLTRCIGGWKMLADVESAGIVVDDWNQFGQSEKVNEFVKKKYRSGQGVYFDSVSQ